MNILMITSYVTITSRPEYSRNKTGFGYMVFDIARAVGKFTHVDLLTSDSRGDSFKLEGVYFLKRSVLLILLNVFRCLSPLCLLRLYRKYHMERETLIRLVYYWLLTGYLKSIIKKGAYDVVHIHGCGFATELWMQVCHQVRQKFIVTLHGLNSFSDTVKLEPAGKKYERDFLKRVAEGEIPITVISSGMKLIIEKTYGKKNSQNIRVVCNSFDFPSCLSKNFSIRKKYNIPPDSKVLLYVGNISKNKNQMQMVDVYMALPEDYRNNIYILFCGSLVDYKNFSNEVSSICENGHLIVCGEVEKRDIPNYYKESDGVVLLSISEGFGLSLIEGMYYGKPCLFFADIDSYVDIYDSNACVVISDRSNQAVVESLKEFVQRKWNKDKIKNHSKKFSKDKMASNYLFAYSQIK